MWGILGLEVFHEEFPPFIIEQQLHINALELLTIVVALKVWGKRLRGKKALILCDNMSSCNVINQGGGGGLLKILFLSHA